MEASRSLNAMPEVVAVLTGDLIKSSQLSATELSRARSVLLSAANEVASWQVGLVVGQSEFFRGDSWQMCLADPGKSLRVSLFLRARLRHFQLPDSRIGIGIGGVDQFDLQRVSLSSGEAFVLSGRALDGMTVHSELRFSLAGRNGDEVRRWLPAVAGLCDALFSRSKARQAEALSFALLPEGLTQQQIASRMNPVSSQQAVNKALRSLYWDDLDRALLAFETQHFLA